MIYKTGSYSNCDRCAYYERTLVKANNDSRDTVTIETCLKKNRTPYLMEYIYGCSDWQNRSSFNMRRIRALIKPVLSIA
jgi:hypothetical protein